MRTSLVTRAVGCGALVLSVVIAAAPVAVTMAAGTTDGTALVVTDPLPGYTHLEGGTLDGRIDVGTLMELQGMKADDVPDLLRDYTGEARTWQSADGPVAIAFVIECDDEGAADEFLRGAMHGTTKGGGVAFEPGLSGTTGYAVTEGTVSVHAVLWRQSKYFVEVFVTAESAERSATDASTLARNQVAFLRDSFHAEPTVDGARAKDEQSAIGYRIGRIIGALTIPVVIALLVVRNQRRKAARRADATMLAGSPPPFGGPAALPPPPQPATQPWGGFAPPQVN